MRRWELPLLLILLVVFAACSDNSDPAAPEPAVPAADRVILVPEEQPNLEFALAVAVNGDTISLAPGIHRGGFQIDKPLTIVGRAHGDSVVTIDTARGHVQVNAVAGPVVFSGLNFVGGGQCLNVFQSTLVSIERCTFVDALQALSCHGARGALTIENSAFRNLGNSISTLEGVVSIEGQQQAALVDCDFDSCGGSTHSVVEFSRGTHANIVRCHFNHSGHGMNWVVHTGEDVDLNIEDMRCTGRFATAVWHQGDELWVSDSWFEGSLEICLVLDGTSRRSRITNTHFRHGNVPALSVRTFESCTLEACSVADISPVAPTNSPVLIVEWSSHLSVKNCTFLLAGNRLLAMQNLGSCDIRQCIATEPASPAFIPPLEGYDLSIRDSDMYNADGGAAWYGLEDFLSPEYGNMELDPLFCDGPAGDFGLQADTPCPSCGAFEVGCGLNRARGR